MGLRVLAAMRAQDLETSLCLLPCVGLLGCATMGGTRDTSAAKVELSAPPTVQVDGWIEPGSTVEPLSLAEAAQRSAKLELAAGNFAAAEAAVSFALEHESALAELHLTRVEAAVALGEFERAESALDVYASEQLVSHDARPAFEREIDNRRLDIRERSRALGSESCTAEIERARQPLQRHADFLSVFNELSGHMSSREGLTIPSSEQDARDELCENLCEQRVHFVRLESNEDAIVGVLVQADDGALFLLPELLRPESESCEDDTHLAYEIAGDRLRVRAFSNTIGEPLEVEPPPVEDWRLGVQAELGAIQAKVAAAGRTPMAYYAGSGYGSSGYGSSGYGSSGYGSSGYGSSGYYSSGCSGYDSEYDYYGYGYCEVLRTVQRDTFIDLRRGEVILDIVRTGSGEAGFGRVAPERESVAVSACGVEEHLPLSWTAA